MSYTCPDYRKARDWYGSVLNMKSETTRDDGKRANLMFGPEPGKGGSFIAARNLNNSASGSAGPKAGAQSVVDHVCYTVANWDEARVRATLKANGLEVTGRDGSLHVYDPFDLDVQIASALDRRKARCVRGNLASRPQIATRRKSAKSRRDK